MAVFAEMWSCLIAAFAAVKLTADAELALTTGGRPGLNLAWRASWGPEWSCWSFYNLRQCGLGNHRKTSDRSTGETLRPQVVVDGVPAQALMAAH